MERLYVSTHNRDKLSELRQLLGENVEILHPGDDDPDVEETGTTLWENALLKARAGFERTGIPTIADDTGLEVDVLDGAPGVYAARFAGPDATYADNRNKLVKSVEAFPEEERTARFRIVIAYVDSEQELRFDGVLEGHILATPRGENGFGYDPVFQPEGDSRTLAELNADEKNKISHRGRALRAFLTWWNNR